MIPVLTCYTFFFWPPATDDRKEKGGGRRENKESLVLITFVTVVICNLGKVGSFETIQEENLMKIIPNVPDIDIKINLYYSFYLQMNKYFSFVDNFF